MLAARPGAAHQHVDLGRVRRQEHRGLPGRVAAADQRDLLAARTSAPRSARPSTRRRGLRTAARLRHAGPPVARAAGDHDGARAQPRGRRRARARSAAASRRQSSAATCAGISISAPNFCACTKARPASAWPGDAGRKAEVVLDPRAGAGLAAEGAAVEHHDRQALRGGIDRGGEPGRPGADDGDVVELVVLGARRPCRGTRASSVVARVAQHRAVRADDQRQSPARRAYCSSSAAASASSAGSSDVMRMAVARAGSSAAAARRATAGAPISTGPPAPASISATRRRISARMIRSPSSASAMISARSCAGGDQQRLDVALGASPSTSAGRPESCADLGQELARALVDDRHHVAEAVALA